jgi:hypothetical protein
MIVLGEGRLSWQRTERISDRYGAVILMHDGDSWTEPSGYAVFDPALTGRRGTLVAEVLETRESTHIGDLFHGFSPTTPAVGEQIRLGSGTVFVEYVNDIWTIGLRPRDGRDVFWLAPNALYRAHEQTVRLMLLDPEES